MSAHALVEWFKASYRDQKRPRSGLGTTVRHPRYSPLSETLAAPLSNLIGSLCLHFSENVKVFKAVEPAHNGGQDSDFISYRVPWPLLRDTILNLDYIFFGYLENHCGFR